MKVLLEIPDNKAVSFMEVLQSISFVKAKPISESKARILSEIKDAIDEVKLIKTGKKTARNAEDFLNEL
jgi:hypothetical protein